MYIYLVVNDMHIQSANVLSALKTDDIFKAQNKTKYNQKLYFLSNFFLNATPLWRPSPRE